LLNPQSKDAVFGSIRLGDVNLQWWSRLKSLGRQECLPHYCPPMPSFLEVCLDAAERGGRILLDWQDRFQAREKGPRDLVTEADLAAQETIRATILKAFPDHDFLGEEEAAERKANGLSAIADRRSPFRWIVDPLDGTTNYVHRLPGFAVSIALQHESEIVAGVVLDPLGRECFVAERGKGATLNGRPLKTSGCAELNQALVAVSFSPHVTRDSPEITRFVEILLSCQSVRRTGSAALNLCYVAAGRLDGYLATSCSIWDVAAGLLLVEEAGGAAAGLEGGAICLEQPELIVAASPRLLQELLRVVRPNENTQVVVK
jgi:myo-inositol-1(or 4)-monophosphatase